MSARKSVIARVSARGDGGRARAVVVDVLVELLLPEQGRAERRVRPEKVAASRARPRNGGRGGLFKIVRWPPFVKAIESHNLLTERRMSQWRKQNTNKYFNSQVTLEAISACFRGREAVWADGGCAEFLLISAEVAYITDLDKYG